MAIAAVAATAPGAAAPQRQRRGGFGEARLPPNPDYDGAFTFCRIRFRNSMRGDGAGWSVDYPRADINLTFRLSELTTTIVSRTLSGEFNHAVYRLTDPELFQCPFVMLTEPGGAFFDEDEAAGLRAYLDKGGFLWADDFWGDYAFTAWEGELRKALPAGEFPVVDLTPDHPIFHTLYVVPRLPQIPSINFWMYSGGATSERGAGSAVPHARAIFDARGRMMVLMTHNTDFGDAFERETDDRGYFETFASEGYAFGIDVVLYALTH
jgi:uncharacterized protein DUF4159